MRRDESANTPDASPREARRSPRAVSDAITAAAVDCAHDPRVSPVARKFLSLLSGREAPRPPRPRITGKPKAARLRAGSFADAADAPPERRVRRC